MEGSPAAQKLELGSLEHPAAARWVVRGATPASFVLLPTQVSWENIWDELRHGPDGQYRAEERWVHFSMSSKLRLGVLGPRCYHDGARGAEGRGEVGWKDQVGCAWGIQVGILGSSSSGLGEGSGCGITPFEGGQAETGQPSWLGMCWESGSSIWATVTILMAHFSWVSPGSSLPLLFSWEPAQLRIPLTDFFRS